MKKILICSLLLLISILGYSQQGYYYEDKFIELLPIESTKCFVIINDSDSNMLSSYDTLIRICENGYLLNSKDLANTKSIQYQSKIYTSNGKNSLIVLPTIILCLKDEQLSINQLSDSFPIEIERVSNTKYHLRCKVKSSYEVLQILSDIRQFEDVFWCEPDIIGGCRTTNPLYDQQYYLNNTGQNEGVVGVDINVEPAWNLADGTNIVVAVIDEGVDKNHEDLLYRVMDGYTNGSVRTAKVVRK